MPLRTGVGTPPSWRNWQKIIFKRIFPRKHPKNVLVGVEAMRIFKRQRVIFLLFTLILLIVLPAPGAAYPGLTIREIRATDCSRLVRQPSGTTGPGRWLEGEIVGLCQEEVVLAKAGMEFALPLASGLQVYLNGKLATSGAVRPVTQGCGVMARVWLDGTGRVRLIDGYFQGVEVEIVFAEASADGGYWLGVRDLGKGNPEIVVVKTADWCKGLDDKGEKEITGSAFIVFDFTGNVRGVYQHR